MQVLYSGLESFVSEPEMAKKNVSNVIPMSVSFNSVIAVF